jgi:hypothetical protein
MRPCEVLLAIAAAAALLAAGIQVGRDVERINALAAEASTGSAQGRPAVITKAQAAARIAPRCPRPPAADLRLARVAPSTLLGAGPEKRSPRPSGPGR